LWAEAVNPKTASYGYQQHHSHCYERVEPYTCPRAVSLKRARWHTKDIHSAIELFNWTVTKYIRLRVNPRVRILELLSGKASVSFASKPTVNCWNDTSAPPDTVNQVWDLTVEASSCQSSDVSIPVSECAVASGIPSITDSKPSIVIRNSKHYRFQAIDSQFHSSCCRGIQSVYPSRERRIPSIYSHTISKQQFQCTQQYKCCQVLVKPLNPLTPTTR